MDWRSTLTGAVIVGALGFGAGQVFSQDKGGAPKMPSPEEMQKMMDEMGALADEHKQLAADAGTWDAETSMWMAPGQPPMKSKATSVRRSILGGHYIVDEFKGDMMGKPFEGHGLHGYSKEKKKYVGVWADSMSSTPEVLWGTADATGKVITFDGEEMQCPMGAFTPRWIVRHDDADHMTFEHWSKYAGMPDYVKEIEVKYTRHK